MRPIAAAVLAAVLLCTGCTALAGTDEVCDDEAVVSCAADGPSLVVTVSATASDEQTLEIARDLHAASADDAHVQLAREPIDVPGLDPEIAAPSAWSLQISPGDLDTIEQALAVKLEIEKVSGTLEISVLDGWPSLSIASIDDFAAVFDAASASPALADGGTYRLFPDDEHLRIVHTPRWVTAELVHDVIAIAVAHPSAEVLLEAPQGGDAPPTLYISRLDAADVDAIDAQLGDPAMASTIVPGTTVEYVLGTLTTDGVVHLSGSIGVPRAG